MKLAGWKVLIASGALGMLLTLACVSQQRPGEFIEIPQPTPEPYVAAEYVYVTQTGEKYHREDCSSIKDPKI